MEDKLLLIVLFATLLFGFQLIIKSLDSKPTDENIDWEREYDGLRDNYNLLYSKTKALAVHLDELRDECTGYVNRQKDLLDSIDNIMLGENKGDAPGEVEVEVSYEQIREIMELLRGFSACHNKSVDKTNALLKRISDTITNKEG